MKKETQTLLNLYAMSWSEALILTWTIRETMKQEAHADEAFNALLIEIDDEANLVKAAEARRANENKQSHVIRPQILEMNAALKQLYHALKSMEINIAAQSEAHSLAQKTLEDIFGARNWSRRNAAAALSLAEQALSIMNDRWDALGLSHLRASFTETYEALYQRQQARMNMQVTAAKVQALHMQALHLSITRAMCYLVLSYTQAIHAQRFAAFSSAILAFNQSLRRKPSPAPVSDQD
ncbi:hypothetical protein KKB55_18495 [Myxococcota bacterium]|nr:hypothetical protein [Myxococcota bacterium]MBU1899736.1 hypothetical protein [Myxococcota bacterium]